VVFLAYRMASGEMRFLGSAFFLGRAPEGYLGGVAPASGLQLVTAKHLIDRVRKRGLGHIFIRVNAKSGNSAWVMTEISSWRFHPSDPSVDVATLPMGVLPEWDHIVVPTAAAFNAEQTSRHEIALGEEVFIVGLFRHHRGKKRNIPIVRVGNLAALDEEKVQVADGSIDAYLIEARSLGGLSGAPVFLNLGAVRNVSGQIIASRGPGPIVLLLGLVHGHYDVDVSKIDAQAEEELTPERINTGIAIVVPIAKILETFDACSPPGAQPIQIVVRSFDDATLADPNLVL
jgi:hypothetical protein